MSDSLNNIISDISTFVSLIDGQSFEGKFLRAQKVVNRFDIEKESVELVFDINGNEKTITGTSLARALVKSGIVEGDTIKVTRVTSKGTKIEWLIEKLKVEIKK